MTLAACEIGECAGDPRRSQIERQHPFLVKVQERVEPDGEACGLPAASVATEPRDAALDLGDRDRRYVEARRIFVTRDMARKADALGQILTQSTTNIRKCARLVIERELVEQCTLLDLPRLDHRLHSAA
jgi:hypothetical protein